MVEISFNGEPQSIASIEDLSLALDRFDEKQQFELWVSVPDGPSMCMLRNGTHAWLMYLRNTGDSGLTSSGDSFQLEVVPYKLCNGQVDEYPLSWCIDIEQCYKAAAYFFINEGAKPDWIQWRESK